MEGKDFFARGHSDRVAEYSRKAGQAIGLDRTNLRHLSWAALLHDIGKVGIVDAILQKKDRLTDEEMAIVREHPVIGQRILQDLDQLRRAAVFVRGHHERWDGTGYPDGLRGREIPLPARILALAECFDTITSHTPYKLGRSVELAAQELRQEKGRMFDPDLVDPFLEAVIL
jgi:HD-GYP domain-containing protein (c-di-GMP phosphodiesterase class II)